MSALPSYPTYKPAGVPWLQQVPEHWGFERAKSVFRAIDVKSKTGKEELLTVSSANGIVKRRESNVNMFKAKTYVGHKLCWPEDLVINSLWAWGRGLGFSREHGIISTAYGVYRLREPQKHLWQYLDYTLRSSTYQWELQVRSKGVWKSRLQLTDASFFDMPILMPPKEDAELIVRYLHALDAKVKRYIRTKRKLIAALQEQKQAIIQRAVTRGLDPKVQLEHSGVEWLGEVPGHWEVRKLKQIVRAGKKITYGIVQPGHPDPKGRFMIRGQDYSFGWAPAEKIFRVSRAVEEPYKRSRVEAGDLVYTIIGAGVGNVEVVPDRLDGSNITQTTARIAVDKAIADSRFVKYCLIGPVGRANVDQYVKGAAQPGLNLEHVRIFLIPFPPIAEQATIAEYVEGQLETFDKSIARLLDEIKRMLEYHTRLVADVVTGAVDVRTAAKAMATGVEVVEEPLEELNLAAEPGEAYGEE